MTVDKQRDFIGCLFDCILFECAGQAGSHNKYTLVDLESIFAHVRLMYINNPLLSIFRRDIYIHQLKLNTVLGLKEYMDSSPNGHYGIFPYQTPVRAFAPGAYTIQQYYVYLPACTTRQTNDFLSSYGERVPSAYQDEIAAVIFYLRTNAWVNGRGSGGASNPLTNGKMGVTKYSRGRNTAKQAMAERVRALELKQKQALDDQHQQQTEEARRREEQERQRHEKDTKQARLEGVLFSEGQRLQKLKDEARSMSITRFLAELKLQAATEDTRRDVENLRRKIENTLGSHTHLHGVQVRLFGSFESGLSTLSSDADFTVYNFVNPCDGKPIHELARILRAAGYGPIKTVANARVPIVSFTEGEVQCDVNINQPMGVHNSQLIKAYKDVDSRFLGLWFGLRQLAKRHGILSGSTGYLSSYALTMMLIVFLQDVTSPPLLPRLQQQSANRMTTLVIDGLRCSYDRNSSDHTAFAARNTKSEGQLLTDFCHFFGYVFKYATQEVNPKLGKIKNRSVTPPARSRRDSRLKDWPICVLDPFIPTRNVAGNCRANHVAEIQQCFKVAYEALEECNIDLAFKRLK
ncbi:hypothetical protein BGX33_005470 [Mortierella sp. NVP41]|nr:hypothetical protein BGX33_005470 [Mortierella sp. NVP41]